MARKPVDKLESSKWNVKLMKRVIIPVLTCFTMICSALLSGCIIVQLLILGSELTGWGMSFWNAHPNLKSFEDVPTISGLFGLMLTFAVLMFAVHLQDSWEKDAEKITKQRQNIKA